MIKGIQTTSQNSDSNNQRHYTDDSLIYKPLTINSSIEFYKSVLHIPQNEDHKYTKLVGKRYQKQMLKFIPKAFIKAFTVQNFNQISDQEFNRFFWVCSFGKWLRWANDKDVKKWRKQLPSLPTKMVVGNYEGMNQLTPHDGLYSMGGECIFEHKGNALAIQAITLKNVTYFPTDGHAWEIAKVFTIYAAYNHTLLLDHPRVHFQLNPFAGHAYRILPHDHIVRKLLEQHFELSLNVNRAVLHSPKSAIGDQLTLPYTSFATPRSETFKFMSQGFTGIKGNDSYQPFEFEFNLPDYCTDYSLFLQAYYDVILEFVEQVLKKSHFEVDSALREWSIAVSNDLPGFEAEFIECNLAKVLAKVILNASVEHSTEHGALGKLPIEKVFLRLRIPAPSSKKEAKQIQLKKMRSRIDYFKHLMTWKMYVNPNNVFLLKDVDYQFQDSHLKQLNKQFLTKLQNVEIKLKKQGVYIYENFQNMATSIQY